MSQAAQFSRPRRRPSCIDACMLYQGEPSARVNTSSSPRCRQSSDRRTHRPRRSAEPNAAFPISKDVRGPALPLRRSPAARSIRHAEGRCRANRERAVESPTAKDACRSDVRTAEVEWRRRVFLRAARLKYFVARSKSRGRCLSKACQVPIAYSASALPRFAACRSSSSTRARLCSFALRRLSRFARASRSAGWLLSRRLPPHVAEQ